MSEPFDPTLYTRPPRLDVPGSLALGRALLAASPRKPSKEVTRSATRLDRNLTGLETAWSEQREPPLSVRRPADLTMDTAWSAFYSRAESLAGLPADRYPEAGRAQVLLDTLFPGPQPLSFLCLAFESEWAESEKRLRQIADAGLASEVDALCGPLFLVELRRAHAAYGEALGITKPSAPQPEPLPLSDLLRTVAQDIGRYTIALLAMIDPDDPDTEAVVRQALAPIDRYREGQDRRESAATPEAKGTQGPTPTPPAPDAPAKS